MKVVTSAQLSRLWLPVTAARCESAEASVIGMIAGMTTGVSPRRVSQIDSFRMPHCHA